MCYSIIAAGIRGSWGFVVSCGGNVALSGWRRNSGLTMPWDTGVGVGLGALVTDENISASVRCIGYAQLVTATSRFAESSGPRASFRLALYSPQNRQVALPVTIPQTARRSGLPSVLPSVSRRHIPSHPLIHGVRVDRTALEKGAARGLRAHPESEARARAFLGVMPIWASDCTWGI